MTSAAAAGAQAQREQHMQPSCHCNSAGQLVTVQLTPQLLSVLQARSQEARANWETALDAKDRAIAQLEEALASRQRALVSASN